MGPGNHALYRGGEGDVPPGEYKSQRTDMSGGVAEMRAVATVTAATCFQFSHGETVYLSKAHRSTHEQGMQYAYVAEQRGIKLHAVTLH